MNEPDPREPCQLCGSPLYYAEQRQSLCRSCAEANGITRICDAPRDVETVGEMLAREGLDRPMCRCHVEPLDGDIEIGDDGEIHASSCTSGLEAAWRRRLDLIVEILGPKITPMLLEAIEAELSAAVHESFAGIDRGVAPPRDPIDDP